ncbi:hypothetical protein QBC39DRAFT_310414 [Podospora conica]|nr:hypothetical protein QBC39DRAFT_310414 [Schizothecium conicum]
MDATLYSVHSFQINIGVGDGAIHLLCTQPNTGIDAQTVVRAVFLDGGETATNALKERTYHPNILKTIHLIEDNFRCHGPEQDGGADGNRPRLKFDAFVVTHWDDDHCQGIMRMLSQDIQKQAADAPTKNASEIKLKRALYHQTTNAPLSFFYTTSWKTFQEMPKKKPDTDLTDAGPLPENATMEIRARIGETKGDMVEEDEWSKGLLLVHATTASLLGRNFFTKTPCTVGSAPAERNAISVDDLMAQSPPQDAGIDLATSGQTPGLYCVAVNGRVIGTAAQFTTVKNKASICLLVIWSKGTSPNAAHRISHYLAGDAHSKMEKAICKWIGYHKDDNRTVAVVKLSHHGASSSNPDALWTELKPQVIIASAGESIGYAHPRWEILARIYTWLDVTSKESKSSCITKTPPLFLTRYPCYYVDGTGDIKPSASGMSVAQSDTIFKFMNSKFEQFAAVWNGPLQLAQSIAREFKELKFNLKDDKGKAGALKYVLQKLHTHMLPVICAQGELRDLWAVESVYVRIFGFDGLLDGGPPNDTVSTRYDQNRATHLMLKNWRTQVKPTSTVLASSPLAQSPPPRGLGPPEDGQEGRAREWDEDSEADSDGDSVQTWELLDEFCDTVLRTLDDDNVIRLVPEDSVDPSRPSDIAIPKKNPLYGFVRQLASRLICLDVTPSPGSGVQVPVAESDGWLWWFRNALESPTARMYFTPTAWPLGKDAAASFTCRADFGPGRVLVLQTAEASKALGVEEAALARMYSESQIMAFGAKIEASSPSVNTNVWTVQELAKLVGMEKSVVLAALGPISLIPATTRPSDDGKTVVPCRNALWFTAGGSHFTRLRLEFTPADEKGLDGFRKWINASGLPQFSVDRVSVTVDKNWSFSYRLDGDLTTIGGTITFSLAVTLAGLSFTAHLTFTETAGMEPQLRLRFQHDHPDENVLGTLFSWVASAFQAGSADDLPGKKWTDAAKNSSLLKAIHPRAFEITIPCSTSGIPKSISAVFLHLQVEVTVGTPSPPSPLASQPLIFFLSFSFGRQTTSSLRGYLWCPPPTLPNSFTRALPNYNPLTDLTPILPSGVAPLPAVDLATLVGLSSPLPKGIPSTITLAELSVSSAGLTFTGELACTNPPDQGLSLDSVRLAAACSFPAAGAKATFAFSLDVTVLLYPGGIVTDPGEVEGDDSLTEAALPAKMRGLLEYVSGDAGHWRLAASVSNLTGAHLAVFFDGAVREAVLDLMGHLEIGFIGLRYDYDAGGLGGEFKFLGSLSVGGLGLNLRFSRDGKDGTWEFVASLSVDDIGENTGEVTLGEMLEELIGDGVPELPAAVSGIKVSQPGEDGDLLRFSCSKMKGPNGEDGNPTEMVLLSASVHIAAVSLTFVQWRGCEWAKEVPSKRIIKVAVSEIGPFEAPLVGTIEDLPFDELAYLWVSDGATAKLPGATQGTKTGVTKGEFDALSEKLTDEDTLFFKSTGSNVGDAEVVLEAGSHFMVIAMNSEGVETAVLDYVFARPGTKNKAIEGWDGPVPPGAPQTAGDKDVSKAPFKAAIGPLSIENIGLQFDFKEQRLGVVLDATFLMGPIGLALIGFGLSVKLGKTPKKLPDPKKPGEVQDNEDEDEDFGGIPISDVKVSLQGMAVSFDRPPVTVAGGFMHSNVDDIDCYAGGLIIGFKPWMIQAVGVYAKVPKKPSEMEAFINQEARKRQRLRVGAKKHARMMSRRIYELDEADEKFVSDDELLTLDDPPAVEMFTMFFVIFRIEGPLFSVGFADISGLTGGVGINTEMRIPTAETVLSFPLIAPSGAGEPGSSPIQSLMALLRPPKTGTQTAPWFSPREESFWFAAGLKATAFQMLAVDAVVVVQLNPYLQLGIYGVAVCDVPSIQSPVKFAHAELGIACTLDIRAGTFKLDAQLSPRSFILDPSCHLTGGMALYSWFTPAVAVPPNDDGSGLPGDWVLTIGGYHQAFNRPKAYPNPPRLGINWSLGSSLRISGEAYFAVTPRVCMAGGKLSASLTLGPLYAWFDAFLDMLINFEPFFFAATGGVSVGVRFSMDLWFVTIRVSVEIGATLMVAGPPMAGMVHVDFWVFGFDIHFGGSMTPRPKKRTFGEFRVAALKSGSNASSVATSFFSGVVDEPKADKGKTSKPFLFNCASGLVPQTKIKGQKETSTSARRVPRAMYGEKKDVWLVQPGPFTFTVMTAFPSSKGTLKDQRPGRVLEKQEMKKLNKDEYNNIFALPMQLKSTMTSDVTVEVFQAKEQAGYSTAEEEEDDEPGIWKVQPILKDVPYSLWGKYDDAVDPSLQGNNVAALLGASQAGGGKDKSTVQLVMGLTITPPPPHLSDDVIPKFNLVRDTKETVEAANFFTKETVDGAWAPEPQVSPVAPEPLDNPVVPGDPDDDDDNEKERQKKELARWSRVKEVWEDNKNDPEEAVRRWAGRLGFADGVLTGKRPASLLNRFNNMVPALPMVAVGIKA